MKRGVGASRRRVKNLRIMIAIFLIFLINFIGAPPATAAMIPDAALNGEPDLPLSANINDKIKTVLHSSKRHVQPEKKSEQYKEGEILVKFKAGVSKSTQDNFHLKHGSSKIKEFSSLRIHHLKLKEGMSVEDAIKLYKKDPDVEYAEPNYIVKVQAVPNDPYFNYLWNMYNTGQTGGTVRADIHAPEAWDITQGTNTPVVAVLDTGEDYTHPDLAANLWVNPGEIAGNEIDDDGNGYVDDVHGIYMLNPYYGIGDPMDDNGHGTHVAGTIGAVGNNAMGVAGVNWNVKIMACKFLGASGIGSIDAAIVCLQYVKTM